MRFSPGNRPPRTISSSSRFTYHDATDPSAPTEIASATSQHHDTSWSFLQSEQDIRSSRSIQPFGNSACPTSVQQETKARQSGHFENMLHSFIFFSLAEVARRGSAKEKATLWTLEQINCTWLDTVRVRSNVKGVQIACRTHFKWRWNPENWLCCF